MKKGIITLVNSLMLVVVLFVYSCETKQEKSYSCYGTTPYSLMEQELNITTEQAALVFADYYFGLNPTKQNVDVQLEVLYENYYIFSDQIMLYNHKTGRLITKDTYWVDGNTKEVIKPRADYIDVLIDLPKKQFTKQYKNPNYLNPIQ